MNLTLEFQKTLEYLVKNKELRGDKYQATIKSMDVLNHHYLQDAFNNKDNYTDMLLTTKRNDATVIFPIFTDVEELSNEDSVDGQLELTFTFSPAFIENYPEG